MWSQRPWDLVPSGAPVLESILLPTNKQSNSALNFILSFNIIHSTVFLTKAVRKTVSQKSTSNQSVHQNKNCPSTNLMLTTVCNLEL